jgi:hypothetical protein
LLAGVSGVASLGIAGCTGDTGNGGNGGSEADTPDPETDTPDPETDTPDPETDTPEPELEEKTEADVESSNESETENQIDKERQEALEKIESAKKILEEGLQIYIEFDSDNNDILDVTSMNDDFSFTDVVNHIRDANEDLDDAEEYGFDDLNKEIEDLRQEYSLIDSIARTQRQGQVTGREVKEYADRTSNSDPNFTQFDDLIDTIRQERNSFEEKIQEVNEIVEQRDEFTIRDIGLYSDKLNQLEAENDIFIIYTDMYSNYKRGIENLNDAKSRDDDDDAEFIARNAQDWFERCLDNLDDAGNELFEEITEKFEEHMEDHINEAQEVIDESRGL